MSSAIQVVRSAEAEAVWVVRDRIRFMGELAGTELAVVEVEVPPGSGTPLHIHRSVEIFRVLSGEISFTVPDGSELGTVVAGPGTVVSVPSALPHAYQNAGGEPAAMLVVVEQPMVTFFRDLGRREEPAAGPPSAEELAEVLAACARHGIELLAGPPV